MKKDKFDKKMDDLKIKDTEKFKLQQINDVIEGLTTLSNRIGINV